MWRRSHGPLIVAIAMSGIALSGCRKSADSPPLNDHFSGRFIFEKKPNEVGGTDTDLVKFSILGNKYSFEFTTFDTRVCPSEGTALDYGTNTVTFVPSAVLATNCDSVHIPRGTFRSAFIGDSLYLAKFDTAQNMRYTFELKK